MEWLYRARLRAHEWAADRFSFVQYPNVRQLHAQRARAQAAPPLTPGQFLAKLVLAVVSLVLIGLAAAAAALAAWIFWLVYLGFTT